MGVLRQVLWATCITIWSWLAEHLEKWQLSVCQSVVSLQNPLGPAVCVSVTACDYNPSTWMAKVGKLPEFKASLGYIEFWAIMGNIAGYCL